MMHDADDATLMRALRAADPLSQTTLEAEAHHRLERSWRQAAGVAGPPQQSATEHRRRLQVAAVVIAALIVGAGATMLLNVITQRDAVGIANRPEAAAVDGSYRATVQQPDNPVVTFEIVDGRIHARADTLQPAGMPTPWRGWDGFGGGAPVFVDEQIITAEATYLRARADEEGPARWYRYAGAHAQWQPRLDGVPPTPAELRQPVFSEGTEGFRRVEDTDAAAQDLARYTADVATADLEFLGWFAPMRGEIRYERNTVTIDVWVDAGGRVQRVLEAGGADPERPTSIRFDRFDELGPIAQPSLPGGEAPVANDALGMTLVACGDADGAQAMRERVRAELDGDGDVAAYEILDGPTRVLDRLDPYDTPDRLFVAAARYRDDVDIDEAVRHTPQRLMMIGVGPDGGESSETPVAVNVCSVAMQPWIELEPRA